MLAVGGKDSLMSEVYNGVTWSKIDDYPFTGWELKETLKILD